MNFAQKYPLVTRAALAGLWILGPLMAYKAIEAALYHDIMGQDSHAYWLAGQGELEYGRRPGEKDAYLYAPVFLTVFAPLTMLPWTLFLPLWICLEGTLLAWLLKPLKTRWAIPLFLLCIPELLVGNIYILLASAAVIGMRNPVAWSFPILTKVTTGVGLLWFAARGDWRRLLHGVGAVCLVVAVSYAMNPGHWHAWLQFLLEHRDAAPDSQAGFLVRCLLAAGLVILGARKHWPWLIAPAMILASPVLVGLLPYTLLAAIPRLARLPRQDLGGSGPRLPADVQAARKP